MATIYLSRRNLQTLLNKLDRNKASGEKVSACTLIKQDTKHPKYPCSDVTSVIAVEDDDYYGTSGRPAGEVHELDIPLY